MTTTMFMLASMMLAPSDAKTADEWIDSFANSWDESTWEKSFRSIPNGFMRPIGDLGWQARMRALQGVVSLGDEAIPSLVRALGSEETPRRIFAAQALGYLGGSVPTGPLLAAVRTDSDAAVRLYAADSLGMIGAKGVEYAQIASAERNNDVRKHLGYARERNGAPLEDRVRQELVAWKAATMATAEVGKPAPDFALESATGTTIRLADFRGKSSVVLVFIYGDT